MSTPEKPQFIKNELNARRHTRRKRSLNAFGFNREPVMLHIGDTVYINFSSNDYLGLSKHPEVISESHKALEQSGAGSTASRLITGTYELSEELEQALARFTGRAAALVFNSGYQANSTLMKTLTNRNSCILLDKLAHNSLVHGALAGRAKMIRYNHNDLNHLEKLLKKHQGTYDRMWIVTEAVFSMDGDRAPLQKMAELARRYGAFFYVDEAHSIGLYGKNGSGLSTSLKNTDILLGTFGKAFGSFGSFVACSAEMKEYLVNFAEGFIYTTALPPAVTGANLGALKLMPHLDDRRKKLKENITCIKDRLEEMGLNTLKSDSQIIPIVTGDEKKTLELAEFLKERHIIATAIRPPTVPAGACRIRITVSSEHEREDLNLFTESLKKFYG